MSNEERGCKGEFYFGLMIKEADQEAAHGLKNLERFIQKFYSQRKGRSVCL